MGVTTSLGDADVEVVVTAVAGPDSSIVRNKGPPDGLGEASPSGEGEIRGVTDFSPLPELVKGCAGDAVGVGLGVVKVLSVGRTKVPGMMVNTFPPLLSVVDGSGDAVGMGTKELPDTGVEGIKGTTAGKDSEGDVSGTWVATVCSGHG